jgi:hypothetical protein
MRIYKKFYYAQAYDPQGWVWQPVFSISEYVDLNDVTNPQMAQR